MNLLRDRRPAYPCVTIGIISVALTFSFVTPTVAAPTSTAFTGAGEVAGLGPDAVGWTSGGKYSWGTPDISVIGLPDGRIRAYFQRMNGPAGPPYAIASAVSSDSGASWTMEPDDRIDKGSNGVGFPYVYRLPNKTYRLYYLENNVGIKSATSTDGVNFTADPGTRISTNAFINDGRGLSCTAIVKRAIGGYRMYCTKWVGSHADHGATLDEYAIFSATSTNLLDWAPEAGKRIGQGVTGQVEGEHPTVLSSDSTGAVSLVAYGSDFGNAFDVSLKEWVFSSPDGLTFGAPTATGLSGTEPSIATLANGSQVMLYGDHSPATGSIQQLARITRTITCMRGSKRRNLAGAAPRCPSGWKPAATITCRKGSTTRPVTAIKPRCPKGWRQIRGK